ncbi:MAG: CreA family protein [Desulfoplanes sp.]|nr:CreA family protein [Desulfoplanes sp.]MDD4650530.1 CreA family protein [Desulfoplanes sp.]
MKTSIIAILIFLAATSTLVFAEQIGSVDTVFKVLGPDDKIVVESFDDPEVAGVTCYLSRAKKGGVSGAMGVAEDTSDASISCRQTGRIVLTDQVRNGKKKGRQVFKKRTSILFKTMQVIRFYDQKKNVLVYLSYSDKLVDGSPKNSISCVPIVNKNWE